ncbi:PAS domain-containing sensor histidine kinase [Nafulsella turpanensis]|uniref:PAS domain-containing sensor histidine kinase n=1 Tax=Nafulsella turpanensis TaxID=1265690 RepID=UPI00135F16D7|nr:PAS domain S-box protein [Nafulsella turpanensis]
MLKGFFESVDPGVLITDRKGVILLVNDAYCSLLGYSEEELKGSMFSHGIVAEQREEAMETHQLLFAQEVKGTSSERTFRHWLAQKKDGARIAVMANSYVLQLSAEERYLITMVSELKQDFPNPGLPPSARGREALQANEDKLPQKQERTAELNHYILKNERKFKSLLENSFEAIILYDEPGFITYASPSVSSTLGYSAEEMLGKKGMSFIHEDDKDRTKALLAQMMEAPGNKVYIVQRVRKKDGSYIWTEAYTTNLLHDENVRAVVSNFRDVTERIEVEEKLRDSEASLNLAQHVANLGSAEFDLVSGEVKNSSGVYAIYDFDLDVFTEDQFNGFEYIHPEDADKAPNLFENYRPAGKEWIKELAKLSDEKIREVESTPFEFRIISASGRLKYLRTRSRFIRDKNGSPVKSILTIQDVSEEKHRRRLLDETSRISRIGGWELDLLTNTMSWTAQSYELFEIPATEELSIERATQFYLPEFQPVLLEAFQKLVTEGTAFDLELKMATATKKEMWVRMLGQSETVNNKVVLVKGSMQDITDRKKAEHEIRSYAQRLQLATEAAGIGIWDWDLETNKIVWDQQMRELYGLPADKAEVEFDDYKKVLHPDDVPEQELLLQEVLKYKKLDSEFRIIIESKVRWIKSYAKVFENEQGEPRRLLGLNWDITRLKETEETLRRSNEELLKINHELDQFVYSTSHNLRAPLTSILGILNLIKNYPEGADLNTYLQLIEKSVTKLDETIQEITDYSRNTRVEVSLEPVNFEAIIEEVVESLSFLEQANKIKISYVTPSGSHFLSDSSRLKMIFTNLISNAIKYASTEGKEPSIFILVEEKRGGATIRIQDNGIGIAKEHQEKIFSMFFRASSKSSGSGLGLYIVKEAIQKLGGTIRVKSNLGKGTEFIIFLPEPEVKSKKL